MKCLIYLTLLISVPFSAAAVPVVFRVSDPLEPGQTALLFGDSIGEDVRARGWRLQDEPIERPPHALGALAENAAETLQVLQASDLSAKVRVNKSDVVITANRFADASVAVQLYAMSYGFIVDGNRAERTGGMYAIGWDYWRQTERAYSTAFSTSAGFPGVWTWGGGEFDNVSIYTAD